MDSNNIVWMDLEMDGLNPKENTILEIATIVSNSELEILEQGPVFTISQPLSRLEKMDEWNTTHHQKSGLWDRVLESKTTLEEAQIQTLAFIKKWTPTKKCPLAGNSIAQDQRFLYEYMPKIIDHLHYRLIDVSTFKELSYRWAPELPNFAKKGSHRALDDILESIDELKYYRKHILKV